MTQQELELLLGQRASLDFVMTPSTLQETVTVTGEAPLVDTRGSAWGATSTHARCRSSGKRPQLDDLTMLAPGSRANAVDDSPHGRRRHGGFQLNVDGQQVTSIIASAGFGQPRFSRDMIAEFEW